MKKVTTALIGCGQRGLRAHGGAAKASEKVELMAVCDVDESRARAAGEQLGVPHFTDHRALMQRDDLESVIIATNAQYHAAIALDAVRAGKHILVEKPLVDSVKTAKQLIAEADAAKVVGIVAYQSRFTEFTEILKREAAAIDPMQALMTVQRGMMLPQYFFLDHYGGIVDTATHTIHMAMHVMGVPQSVYGSIRRGTFRGDETIDVMNLMMEFDDARCATVISSIGGVQTPNIIQVIGKHGSVSSLDRRKLKVVRHQGFELDRTPIGLEVREIETRGEGDPVGAMLDHFADLIRGITTEYRGATLYEGMLALAVSEAMVLSAQRGARVPLKEILGS